MSDNENPQDGAVEEFSALQNEDLNVVEIVNKESSTIFFYIHVGLFSILGCLARIIIDKVFGSFTLLEDVGEVVNESFMSNMVGSFIMGALHGSKMGQSRLLALYVGLAIGFCGSLTTWSKWNQQLSLALIGETITTPQNQVLSIVSWFVGFHAFLGSYVVGLDFGKFFGEKLGNNVIRRGAMIADATATVLLILMTSLLIVVVTVAHVPYVLRLMGTSLILSPFGACLRFWIGTFNIDKWKLPLTTLSVNVSGSVLLSAIHVISTQVSFSECDDMSSICWPTLMIQAVSIGFCDSLTVVSTFVAEIYSLRHNQQPLHTYGYAILSVIICQTLCGIINGVSFHLDGE